jgi:hypothetical protein
MTPEAILVSLTQKFLGSKSPVWLNDFFKEKLAFVKAGQLYTLGLENLALGRQKMPSRTVLLCIGGFGGENYNHYDEWERMVTLYPNTECLGLNWKADQIEELEEEIRNLLAKGKATGKLVVRNGPDILEKMNNNQIRSNMIPKANLVY